MSFLKENDYKTNLLRSFVKDHTGRHALQYEADCIYSPELKALPTLADKDRFYVECHRNFLKNLRENVSQDLEVKARQVF